MCKLIFLFLRTLFTIPLFIGYISTPCRVVALLAMLKMVEFSRAPNYCPEVAAHVTFYRAIVLLDRKATWPAIVDTFSQVEFATTRTFFSHATTSMLFQEKRFQEAEAAAQYWCEQAQAVVRENKNDRLNQQQAGHSRGAIPNALGTKPQKDNTAMFHQWYVEALTALEIIQWLNRERASQATLPNTSEVSSPFLFAIPHTKFNASLATRLGIPRRIFRKIEQAAHRTAHEAARDNS